MLQYIVRRIILAIPTFFVISIISFVLIQLPPGDFLTSYAANLAPMGEQVSADQLETLREAYGLGQPVYVQYAKWMSGILLHGDFGRSLEWGMAVDKADLGAHGLSPSRCRSSRCSSPGCWPSPSASTRPRTSTRRATICATFVGFVGLGVPSFMIALVLMWVAYSVFGLDVGGLFSTGVQDTRRGAWPSSGIMLKHLWIPAIVLGLGGTAGLIRTMRANTLDELHKPYVMTAAIEGAQAQHPDLEVSGARGAQPVRLAAPACNCPT